MKNTSTNYEEMLRAKKAMLEEVENLLREVGYRENGILTTYEASGEEQRKDENGCLLFLDEDSNKTTDITDRPYMRTIYKDVIRKVSDLDEDEKAKYEALQKIREALVALV